MNQVPEILYLGQNLKQYVMKEAVIYKILRYRQNRCHRWWECCFYGVGFGAVGGVVLWFHGEYGLTLLEMLDFSFCQLWSVHRSSLVWHLFCLYLRIKKQLPNCLKGAETDIVLSVLDVRAYIVSFSASLDMNQVTEKLYLGQNLMPKYLFELYSMT
jgi:hypothetical protein